MECVGKKCLGPELEKGLQGVVLVSADGWQGLYIDGVLRLEGHSLSISEVLVALDQDYTEYLADQGWIENMDGLPQDIRNIRVLGAIIPWPR